VAKYMGDGVLAYFGYPRAHEDDAERAVRAGLALVDAVGRLSTAGEGLCARVGIATGITVVGDLIGSGVAQEHAVIGETPNLAARLQTVAQPNSVVIAASTRRLVRGLFEYADLGTFEMKGYSEPVRAWCVHGESTVESRYEALHLTNFTTMVGRDEEIELLLRRWEQAKSGNGRVVLLSGEPGIGKSHIIAAVQERIEHEPHIAVRYFCSGYHTDSALHPTIAQLKRYAAFERGDTPETRLEKLAAVLAPAPPSDDDMSLLAELLSIPTRGRYSPLQLTPQRKKERTFEALLLEFERLARRRPVLMVYEDVHWIDPTSRELLDLTIERARRLPMLLLVTFRPEFQPPWTGQPHVVMLTLNRLDRHEGAELVKRITRQKTLPSEVLNQIVEHTDGIPLFIEELTKTVLESGWFGGDNEHNAFIRPLPALTIPTTLHDSLMARLDRLASVKQIAQIGAVIGREFSYELLAAVACRPDQELRAALDQLTGAGLTFQRGSPPHAFYTFKHMLVRDTAYNSLLRSQRQLLHGQIATVLSDRETEPEVLAYHFSKAGLVDQAVAKWLEAAEGAWGRAAHREAVAHLQHGLQLIIDLPSSDEKARAELRVQNMLGLITIAAEGPSATAEAALARARGLGDQLGEPAQLFPVLFGQWYLNLLRMDLRTATHSAEELLENSAAISNDSLGLQAHHACWTTSCLVGNLHSARVHAEAGVALYSAEQHHILSGRFAGHDPGVCCRYTLGIALWLLGYPDQSIRWIEESLGLARTLDHPLTHILAGTYASWAFQLRREPDRVRDLANITAKHCNEQNVETWGLAAATMTAWVRATLEQDAGVLAPMQQLLRKMQDLRFFVRRSYYIGLFAHACAVVGDVAPGLAAVDAALDVVREHGEGWYEPELHRLRANLLLAGDRNQKATAERALRQALYAARQSSAKSFELRTACDLARLWAESGERQKARDLLTPVCDWFAEGFETPDLKDGKVLLDELSG
jgi:predicted ATPase